MKKAKIQILWSGITGRTGVQASIATKKCDFAEIVAGVCRNDDKFYNYEELNNIKEEFDIIVDFSNKDSFDEILAFALKVRKPLISGTSGLSNTQINALEDASQIISIFRGGNFRFEVKKFIDEVVEYSKNCDKKIKLVETHYKTKKVPSETAKVIVKRILDETGKIIEIDSFLKYDRLINDWRIGDLHCRVCGFKQLGKDVLKIASMMINKKPNGIYDLDRLIKDNDSLFENKASEKKQ